LAKIRVGAAIVAGFGLIRRRPLSILAWGLLPVLVQVGSLLLLAPLYLATLGPALQAIGNGGAGMAPPAPLPQSFQLQALGQLSNLVQIAVGAIVYCAIWRAMLHPGRSSFASFRIGAPELLFAVLTFAGTIALTVGVIVLLIPTMLLGAIAGAIAHDVNIAVLVAFPVFGLVALISVFYLLVRFSLVGPMMVADGRFHLFESWTQTRGHVGGLTLVGLGVLGLLLVSEIVFLAAMFAIGAASIAAVGGLQAFSTMIQHAPQALFARLWPFLAGYVALLVPIAGCITAIAAAPWAKVYLDLHPDASDIFA
jgi:hypothetical protein